MSHICRSYLWYKNTHLFPLCVIIMKPMQVYQFLSNYASPRMVKPLMLLFWNGQIIICCSARLAFFFFSNWGKRTEITPTPPKHLTLTTTISSTWSKHPPHARHTIRRKFKGKASLINPTGRQCDVPITAPLRWQTLSQWIKLTWQ